MAVRKIRTREQKLEDSRKETARLEQETIQEAINLYIQGEAWQVKSAELQVKGAGAKQKADSLLKAAGHDPDVFWTEYKKGKTE